MKWDPHLGWCNRSIVQNIFIHRLHLAQFLFKVGCTQQGLKKDAQFQPFKVSILSVFQVVRMGFNGYSIFNMCQHDSTIQILGWNSGEIMYWCRQLCHEQRIQLFRVWECQLRIDGYLWTILMDTYGYLRIWMSWACPKTVLELLAKTRSLEDSRSGTRVTGPS